MLFSKKQKLQFKKYSTCVCSILFYSIILSFKLVHSNDNFYFQKWLDDEVDEATNNDGISYEPDNSYLINLNNLLSLFNQLMPNDKNHQNKNQYWNSKQSKFPTNQKQHLNFNFENLNNVDNNYKDAYDHNLVKESQRNLRDMEFMPKTNLWGEHKISGGSSEVGKWIEYALMGAGAQDDDETEESLVNNIKQSLNFNILNDSQPTWLISKIDNLPAYCYPPNPCPLYSDLDELSSPCDPNVDDTIEFNQRWIRNQMASRKCDCDSEHMKECPIVDKYYNKVSFVFC